MRLIFTTVSLLIFCITTMAQETNVSPDQALDLFKNERYEQALPMYEKLIERYDREPKYNYYYGVCLVEQRQNNSEAIRRLKFALQKRVNRDVHYYLGKAYQNAYQFELASGEFTNFLKYAGAEDPRHEKAERAILDCNSAEKLVNKHFSIKVVKKDTVNEKTYISAYNLPEDAGTLIRNKSFFKTGVPPENIMYRTEKSDEVYFVLQESDSTKHDIYKMEQLLDRWSGSQNLREPVNSDYDDKCPFLMVDGTTFFFASDRPGGMGGLDIYRSFHDAESNTFSEPENLGPPFNSPDDDYMFAADPFGERAWFTTNRGVEPGKAVVVKIIWDNSVIKNLTEDIEQIKEISRLPLVEGDLWEAQKEQPDSKTPQSLQSETEQFRFHINDTLVYTRYEHFLSDAARAEFKRGRSIDVKKDSLEQLMRNKRQRYAQSYNQEELNRLMEEILELEKTVYGHGDQMKRHYIRARQLETEKIKELKDRGAYQGIQKTNSRTGESTSKSSLKPAGYSFYTDEEFLDRKQRLSVIYDKFFNPSQVQSLQRTDSMYTWAKILKLEASKLLEQTVNNNEQEASTSFMEKMRNIDSLMDNQESGADAGRLHKRSRDVQRQALEIYHEALDQKYNIYRPTIQELAESSGKGSMDAVISKTQSYFEKANNGISNMQIWNSERYEQLGGLKRQAIEMIEAELFAYSANPSEATTSAAKAGNSNTEIQQPPQAWQQTRNPNAKPANTATQQKSAPKPENIVKTAFNGPVASTDKQPVFKIQIGVFRNTPDGNALAKIPEVSSEPLPEQGLTKYFSGKWTSYGDAQKHISRVQENGFPGAFVVAFINGKQISVSDARNKQL